MVVPEHPPVVASAFAHALVARVRCRYEQPAVEIVGLPSGPFVLEVKDATHPLEAVEPAQVNRRVPADEYGASTDRPLCTRVELICQAWQHEPEPRNWISPMSSESSRHFTVEVVATHGKTLPGGEHPYEIGYSQKFGYGAMST